MHVSHRQFCIGGSDLWHLPIQGWRFECDGLDVSCTIGRPYFTDNLDLSKAIF